MSIGPQMPSPRGLEVAGVSDRERQIIHQAFSNPLEIPPLFKGWLEGYFTALFDKLGAAAAVQNGLSPIVPAYVYDQADVSDIQNDATERTIYSKLIAAGDLELDRAVRLSMFGDVLYNRSATDTVRIKAKLGSTVLLDFTHSAVTSSLSAARRGWDFQLVVKNQSAANAQAAMLKYGRAIGPGDVVANVGAVSNTGGGSTGYTFTNSVAVDTTVSQTLSVTVQWSVASVSNSWRQLAALLELM